MVDSKAATIEISLADPDEERKVALEEFMLE